MSSVSSDLGASGLGQSCDSFAQLAGVVGIAVDDLLREGQLSGRQMLMVSNLSDDESCSGRRASGWLLSLRTVTWARDGDRLVLEHQVYVEIVGGESRARTAQRRSLLHLRLAALSHRAACASLEEREKRTFPRGGGSLSSCVWSCADGCAWLCVADCFVSVWVGLCCAKATALHTTAARSGLTTIMNLNLFALSFWLWRGCFRLRLRSTPLPRRFVEDNRSGYRHVQRSHFARHRDA